MFPFVILLDGYINEGLFSELFEGWYPFLMIDECKMYLNFNIHNTFIFRTLTVAELQLFEKGDPEAINPEMSPDEQADLLPYNRCVTVFPQIHIPPSKISANSNF